jgi:hypothetical protein
MANLVDSFDTMVAAAHSAAAQLPTDAAAFTSLGDDELLAAQRMLAATRRAIDACAAVAAGEIGRRSRPELGYSGLAQRSGFRTAEKLVQHETGSTARDAVNLVKVGVMVHDAQEPFAAGDSWMQPVGRAVAAGEISVEAAKAIRSGLGDPSEGVTPEALAGAALELVKLTIDADALFTRARELRDDLDEAGIIDRERAIYEQRGVRRVNRPNGLRRYIIDGDVESTAFLDSLYDTMTSPRRGGPRFVSADDRAWADAVKGDERTTDQYVHDGMLHLLRSATLIDDADTRAIVGSRLPAVKLLASVEDLVTGSGHGRIEGIDIPVSIATVERAVCAGSTVNIDFYDGQPLNLGREQRLFSAAQRLALAARDGGCMWMECDRPPSWTEAHHIDQWERDHGRTDIADGILLCRYHHMLLHNNGWRIVRDGAVYWLVPPKSVDAQQVPVRLSSKSAALRDLQPRHLASASVG